MKAVLRFLLFALCFSLEVRVKAAEIVALPNQKDVTQEPEGCLKTAAVCAVRSSRDRKLKLAVGDARVVLDASSAVVRQSSGGLTFVDGTIWIKADGDFRVATEFGEIAVAGGEFWVSRTDGKVWVSAISGVVRVKPRGASHEIGLDPGEENWLSGVASNGVAQAGLPRPIQFQSHVYRWARLYPGSRRKFATELKDFSATWHAAVEANAGFHREQVERRLASIEDERRQREEERRKVEERNRYLRDLFRKRTLLN